MKIGEVARELSVCPCVVPRLVKLERLSARITDRGEMDIDPESVRKYKNQARGRKYIRA